MREVLPYLAGERYADSSHLVTLHHELKGNSAVLPCGLVHEACRLQKQQHAHVRTTDEEGRGNNHMEMLAA